MKTTLTFVEPFLNKNVSNKICFIPLSSLEYCGGLKQSLKFTLSFPYLSHCC